MKIHKNALLNKNYDEKNMPFLFVLCFFLCSTTFYLGLLLWFFLYIFVCCCLLSCRNCARLNAFFRYFSPFFNPGYWIVSESEDEISDLQSYESGEYESEEVDSEEELEEEVEMEEEESDEIEESDNDIEVMEILAEAQKQNQTEKRSDSIEIDRNEKIETISTNNSNTFINSNVTDRPVAKVSIKSHD